VGFGRGAGGGRAPEGSQSEKTRQGTKSRAAKDLPASKNHEEELGELSSLNHICSKTNKGNNGTEMSARVEKEVALPTSGARNNGGKKTRSSLVRPATGEQVDCSGKKGQN